MNLRSWAKPVQAVKLADRNQFLPAWAGDKLPGTKFSRDNLEIPRYADIEARFKLQAQSMVQRFMAGDISREDLLRGFKADLYRAETEAFAAGKRAGGKRVFFITPAEQRMLVGRHSRNMRYFNRFVRDMEVGKGGMPYTKRAALYANSLWSLYNRGQSDRDWEDPLAPNARYDWTLDPDAEHCQDCLDKWRASRERGGFTWDELIEVGFPGENCQCIVNCRCHIRPIVKRQLQQPRIEQAVGQETAEAGILLLKSVLGGDNMPIAVPAEGLPQVRILPDTVATSITRAGSVASELAKRLPEGIRVMVFPDKVIEAYDSRTYIKDGLAAQVRRDPDTGVWTLASLYLLDDNGMPVGKSYNVPWVPEP